MNMQKSNENTLRGCLSNDFYWFWFLVRILLTCWH